MRKILLPMLLLWMNCAWSQLSSQPSCPTSSSYRTGCVGLKGLGDISNVGEITNGNRDAHGTLTLAIAVEYTGDQREGMPHRRGTSETKQQYKTSFNCAMAKLPTDIAICEDEKLAALDIENNNLFKKAGDIDEALSRNILKTSYSKKMACGYNKICIENTYSESIAAYLRVINSQTNRKEEVQRYQREAQLAQKNNAEDGGLVKTKCFKVEEPVGEVCLFEDRKAVADKKDKYKNTCEAPATLSIKSLTQSELRVTDANGAESDRVKIEYLSTLNLINTKVNGKKSFYTSHENSACSVWRGSVNTPFWVTNGKITYFKIDNQDKSFMTTIRKSWSGVYDGFLEGISEPSEKNGAVEWQTSYIRYQYIAGRWVVRKKVVRELTDFEIALNEKDFPLRITQ